MDHNYCKEAPVSYTMNVLHENASCKQEQPTLARIVNKQNCSNDVHKIYRNGTNIPRKPKKNQNTGRPCTIQASSLDLKEIYRKGTNVPRKPFARHTPEMIQQRRELKSMRARVARLSKRMDKMKRAHKFARQSTKSSNDNLLTEKLSREAATIFKNNLKNDKRTPKGRRYSKELKEFASTLLGHSPKAYAFCR